MFMFNKVFSFFSRNSKSERYERFNRFDELIKFKQRELSDPFEYIKPAEKSERFETDFKNMNKDRKMRKIKEV